MKLNIEAKNSLENYIYSVKSSILDEKVVNSLSDQDKTTINTTVEETLKWLGDNTSVGKEAYEKKKEEVEGTLMPIMSKLGGGQQSGSEGMSGGMPAGFDASKFTNEKQQTPPEQTFYPSKIEEVD